MLPHYIICKIYTIEITGFINPYANGINISDFMLTICDNEYESLCYIAHDIHTNGWWLVFLGDDMLLTGISMRDTLEEIMEDI